VIINCLKNYISCGRKEKEEERSRKHVTVRATLKRRSPILRSREFRESFVKIVEQPHSFNSWIPNLKNTVVSFGATK